MTTVLLVMLAGGWLVARWGLLFGGCLMGGWGVITTGIEVGVKAVCEALSD